MDERQEFERWWAKNKHPLFLEKNGDSYMHAVAQCAWDSWQARAALAAPQEVERLQQEVHDLAWNLAGCSTYAMGYGLDTPHSPELARPALDDVRKMALRLHELESLTAAPPALAALRELVACVDAKAESPAEIEERLDRMDAAWAEARKVVAEADDSPAAKMAKCDEVRARMNASAPDEGRVK